MLEHTTTRVSSLFLKLKRVSFSLSLLLLLIEFFDELTFGINGAALPSLRRELQLTYAQAGLLLGLPGILSTFIEPAILLLGDTDLRKRLVAGGGLIMAFSLLLVAGARSYPLLLLAFVLSFPASGAFVTLSQATLMDLNPSREPHMMARWTVAGTLGNLIGPLILAGGFSLALGWRWAYVFLALFGIALTLLCLVRPFPAHLAANNHSPSPARLLANLREAVRNPGMLRWIGLLQTSDLMMDVFTSFLAFYFTDLAGATPAQASLILSAAMLADLGSDLVLIPLLERVPGRSLVRASAGLTAGLYILWLLVPGLAAKVVLLLFIRFFTMGWYQILQGEAYASVPGKSATVAAVDSLAGFGGSLLIWTLGLIADRFGLGAAMWLLLIGPVSLWLFIPRHRVA